MTSVTVRSHGGPLGGRALLIKRLAFGAVHESLENDRTIPDSGESARRDRQVVANQVEFRELRLPGKIKLVRMRDADLASLDREHLGGFFFSHENRLHLLAPISAKTAPVRNHLHFCHTGGMICAYKRNGAHVQKLRKRRIAPVKYLWPIICASSILEICSNFLLAKSTSRYFVEKSQQ